MDPAVRREGGEQRLVLDPLLGRRERSFVFDVSVREVAADGGQGIGVAALVIDRLDEHPGAVIGRPEERCRVAAVVGDRRQLAHRIATRGEHPLHKRGVDDATRRADREVDDRADRGAESDCTDRVERKVRADVDPRQRDQQHRAPRETPEATREVGRGRGRERGRDRRVPRRVPVARDARTAHDHVLQQVERPTPLHEIAHVVRHDIGADTGREHRERHPPAPECQREPGHRDNGVERAQLHHRLERDAEPVGQVVHQAEDVELDPAGGVHARDRRARAEDGEPEPEPGQVGRMPLAGDQARMCSERSPSNVGSKTRSVKCQLAVGEARSGRDTPRRGSGADRDCVTWSTVKYDRAVAVAAVDGHRDVRDLMHRARRAVVVDDHRVVERARFGAAAPHVIVARRAQLGVGEQCGYAVEITTIEPKRILVDERSYRFGGTGNRRFVHRRIGIRE